MEIRIDDRDAELMERHKWKVSKRGYVYRWAGHTVLLHREVLAEELVKAGSGAVIDHINGDKLDNRRSNLRVVTQSENVFNMHKLRSDNTSGVTGVSWFRGAWVAFHGRRYLGRFETIEAAAEARDRFSSGLEAAV